MPTCSFARLLIAASLVITANASCTTDAPESDPWAESSSGKEDGTLRELELTPQQRTTLTTKAATCPFMRAGIALGVVRVHGTIEQPLGNTSDAVRLGNAGGGDLGRVLAFFAAINHNRKIGPAGVTSVPVPEGTFGLWFPGSNGAHPGHSTILMGDPAAVGSGRFSAERLSRLTSFSSQYPDGKRYISREQLGEFIAQNVEADPSSRGFDLDGLRSISSQVVTLLARAAQGDPNVVEDTLHLMITANDLVNSAGEYGLLVTRFADGTDSNGNPVISVAAVEALFRDGVFPAGWEKRRATAIDWAKNTLSITKSAIFASWGF
jgi:hypothetical protein